MTKHNAKNERIKRKYLIWLREAKRQSEDSVDSVAAAIARFEAYNRCREFKFFHHQQAVAFKRHLAGQANSATGEKLSKATQHAALSHVKRFIQWLAGQPGYKSITYSDAEYFSLPEKDARIATSRRDRSAPDLDQILHVIRTMPTATDIQKRNRALIAFILLTGARDRAVASLKLKHVDLDARSVFQDARDVQTKFSKTFTTFFFPVGDDVVDILKEWVGYLRAEKHWGSDDPLFPRTRVAVDANAQFAAQGLDRRHWSDASPIRKVFREAFEAAGLPYFHPHSFRNTLVALGQKLCKTPEEFKAWSQNLGHEGVLTTFYSYGQVATQRQGELIGELGRSPVRTAEDEQLVHRLIEQIRQGVGA
jgi:integrase/recombinase XerD